MAAIDLRYGRTAISFEYDPIRMQVIAGQPSPKPLSDAEIAAKLDEPIGSPTLDEIVQPGMSVLIVVPDATRQTGAGQVVNLLVRRLIADGISPSDIALIFAGGIHRPVTSEEKSEIVTPFIYQRIRSLDHNAFDPLKNFRLGTTSAGIEVELDWTLTEFDRVILVGGVSFHYFAGFTGGRKLICPGLASARTIEATHKLAFDSERRTRRDGVGTALLDGNAVHEAFVEAAAFARPAFAVNGIVNDSGELTDLYCGDWILSHRAACDAFAAANTVNIRDKRELVIAGCGGFPHDINLIQAHKALESAAAACSDGGTIILVAECREGPGRSDFADWFEAGDPDRLAERLCSNYQVNGQTAWSLLVKTRRFDVRMITELDDRWLKAVGARRIVLSGTETLSAYTGSSGYIIPFGAKVRVVSEDTKDSQINAA
jgi:nickel-dependent lactate racemase